MGRTLDQMMDALPEERRQTIEARADELLAEVEGLKALRALAETTGGEAFFPESLPEVRPALERIAGEIRTQYTLSYIPTNRSGDGAYRKIQVRAETQQGKGLAVTTRIGYFSPKTPVAAHDAPKL